MTQPIVCISFDEPDELTSDQQNVVQEFIRKMMPVLKRRFDTRPAILSKTADGAAKAWREHDHVDALIVIRLFPVVRPATFMLKTSENQPTRAFVLSQGDPSGISIEGKPMMFPARLPSSDLDEIIAFVDELLDDRMAGVRL